MARVAAISAGPRSASPRGKRALSFGGFLGLSFMAGVGTSACRRRQARSSSPRPALLRGEVEIRAALEFRVRVYCAQIRAQHSRIEEPLTPALQERASLVS